MALENRADERGITRKEFLDGIVGLGILGALGYGVYRLGLVERYFGGEEYEQCLEGKSPEEVLGLFYQYHREGNLNGALSCLREGSELYERYNPLWYLDKKDMRFRVLSKDVREREAILTVRDDIFTISYHMEKEGKKWKIDKTRK